MSSPSLDSILRPYDYVLPPELIAQVPASPRDSARLLVHERASGKTEWAVFRDIGNFLPKNALLVLNETKVIPARLPLQRASGGRIEVLYLRSEMSKKSEEMTIRVLSPKRLHKGDVLLVSPRIRFIVEGVEGSEWILRPQFAASRMLPILHRYGTVPLPPYIKHSPLSEAQRKREYQTVFAKEEGSIAAPTASLHCTKSLLHSLRKTGIETATVTLHVHLGTFAPLTEEQWQKGRLHTEEYHISPKAQDLIHTAQSEGRPIIAVGTTVVRTLESAVNDQGHIVRPSGSTDLFIREGYRFKIIDGLITNFHVPRSSLLMLVSAFAGRETIMDLYRQAIQKKLRFFSFGDAMLIL